MCCCGTFQYDSNVKRSTINIMLMGLYNTVQDQSQTKNGKSASHRLTQLLSHLKQYLITRTIFPWASHLRKPNLDHIYVSRLTNLGILKLTRLLTHLSGAQTLWVLQIQKLLLLSFPVQTLARPYLLIPISFFHDTYKTLGFFFPELQLKINWHVKRLPWEESRSSMHYLHLTKTLLWHI